MQSEIQEKHLRYLRSKRKLLTEYSDENLDVQFNYMAFEYIKQQLFKQTFDCNVIFFHSPNKKPEVLLKETSACVAFDKYLPEYLWEMNMLLHKKDPFAGALNIGFKHLSEFYFLNDDEMRAMYWGNIHIELSEKVKLDTISSPLLYFQKPLIETFVLFHEIAHIFIGNGIDEDLKIKIKNDAEKQLTDFLHSKLWNKLSEVPELKGIFSENLNDRNLIMKNKFLNNLIEEMSCDAIAIEQTYKFLMSAKKTFLLANFNIIILCVMANIRWIDNINFFIKKLDFGMDYLHTHVRMHWAREIFSKLAQEYPESRNFCRFPTADIINTHNGIFMSARNYLFDTIAEYEALEDNFKLHVFNSDVKINLSDIYKISKL